MKPFLKRLWHGILTSYVVVFYEGEYFRQPAAERTIRQKNAIADDPLHEPLRQIGVDGPGFRRLVGKYGRGIIQRWIRITDAAMHEKPKGFAGFRVSPAAFLIDGIQNNRTPPDWYHAHEKRQEKNLWEQKRAAAATDEIQLRRVYEQERAAAFQAYLASAEGRAKFEQTMPPLRAFYKVTEPHRFETAAHEAAIDRIERLDFHFPEYTIWELTRRTGMESPSA